MKIEFYRHNVNEQDIDRVCNVLRSIFLSTGQEVAQFEDCLAAYLGCNHTIGVTSCTAALHLSLLACGIGSGDEVITTPMTFVATANAILHAGATPVFIDVEPDTGNMDISLIKTAITPRTKAVLPVHLYGQMCDMKGIREIADKHQLYVIEDAAHSLEAERDCIRPGQLSDAACFSFYATKNITSGEGGAIVTNNASIAEKIKLLRLHGMSKGAEQRYTAKYEHWDIELCGWKYNMDNIQAALLLGQMERERLETNLSRRDSIWHKYEQAFSGRKGLDYPKIRDNVRSARHLFTIWVPPENRDKILWGLQDKGIGVAVNFRAVHLLKYYRNQLGYQRRMFPEAERIGDSTITIPLYPSLNDDEVNYICETVIKQTSR